MESWIATNYFPILFYFFNSLFFTKSWKPKSILCSTDTTFKQDISTPTPTPTSTPFFQLIRKLSFAVYLNFYFFTVFSKNYIRFNINLSTCSTFFQFLSFHENAYLFWTEENSLSSRMAFNIFVTNQQISFLSSNSVHC